jgi:O-antigen/teichoic acid export membrane protein
VIRAFRLESLRLVLRGAVGNAGLNAAYFVLNLVIALILSHLLGAGGYGAYAFGIAWATLLAVPGVLGIPSLLVRELVAYRVREAWGHVRGVIRRANQVTLTCSCALSLVFATIVWLSNWPADRLLRPTLLALPLVPLISFVSIRQGAMQAFGRVVLARTPETLVSPILTILLVLLFYFGRGNGLSSSSAVAATVIGALVAALVGVVLLRRTIPASVRKAPAVYETRMWAIGALPLVITAAIQTLNGQLGTIFLGALDSSRAAGIFSVASRASAFVAFFLLATVPTLMPTIAELRTEGQSASLQQAVTRSARRVFLISLPLGFLLIVFARPVLSAFGTDFEGGATALRILCVGQLINIASGFVGTIMMMINRAGQLAIGVAAGGLVNLSLCAALIPTLGMNGAAIAGAASLSLMNVLLVYLLWRSERIYSPVVGHGLAAL